MAPDALAGRRILVVEDELLIAVLVERFVLAHGGIVVGPASKLEAALRLAGNEELDGAILDVTIRGGEAYPVADKLRERGIPFVLASGYGDWALPPGYRNLPRLTKPFTLLELEEHVALLCHRRDASVPASRT